MSKIALIHDDGTPILRRLLRLRALARSGKSVYIEQDPVKIRQAVTILGLEHRQVVKIKDIPDVQINRSATKSSGRQKKEVMTDSVWVTCNHNKVVAGPLNWSRNRETISNCTHGLLGSVPTAWIESVIRSESSGKGLLYLTDGEVARALRSGKIDAERRLDLVLIRHLMDDELKDRLQSLCLYQSLGRAVRSDSVRTVMLERLGAPITQPTQPLVALYQTLVPDMVNSMETEAARTVSELAERYPLLFRFDTQAALDYIAMCDNSEELAVSQ